MRLATRGMSGDCWLTGWDKGLHDGGQSSSGGRSLTGKVGAVASLATTCGVNVLALQETMLASDSERATSAAFKAAGWEFHRGPQGASASGAVAAGVAFITDVPSQVVDIPEELEFGGRVMAIKVARAAQRPLLAMCVYMPARDRVQGNSVAAEVVQWARNTGEEFVLLGDWNRPEDTYPLAGYLAKGTVWTMDGGQLRRDGTFRRAGKLTTHIDYGLASPGLLVDGRTQHLGVADHDLVTYQLRAFPEEDSRRWQPQRRLVAAEPADWDTIWTHFAADFDEAVINSDLDQAWQLLSQAAEDAMADQEGRPARPRALPGRPVVQERHQTRTKELQTLLERRLRRVARRASEATKNGNERLREKLTRDLISLAAVLPDLPQVVGYDNIANYLNGKADEEAQRARAARIRRWKHDIQEDVGAMAKWITSRATNAACDVSQLGECPSKGAAAERLTASLDKLWGEASDFNTARLSSFLDTMGPATQAAECEVHFDGHLLRRHARKAKHKAGGLDGWSGELVAALPLDFFNHLAKIWTAIVKGGKLPLGWKQIRVAGIPKPDGGLRPLALTQMAWRLGASEVLAQLRPWFSSWMPECLHGGLPGRSVDAIHEQLGGLLEQRAAKRTFCWLQSRCEKVLRPRFPAGSDRNSPVVGSSNMAGDTPCGLLHGAGKMGGSCWRFCPQTGGGRGFTASRMSLLPSSVEFHDGDLVPVRPVPGASH